MKVIVNESGFYGGNWFDAGPGEIEMHAKISAPFLPPYVHQLSLPTAKPAAKTVDSKAD